MQVRLGLCSSLPLLVALLSPHAHGQNAPTTVNVDLSLNRHAINPNIYGVAFASKSVLSQLNLPLNRQGGNNMSRYNWKLNATNLDNDWYFESLPFSSTSHGANADSFIAATKGAGGQAMITIPTIGWVANLGPNRGKLCSFSIAKYGAQTGSDAAYFPDAGNGILTATNAPVLGNDPHDANVPSDSNFQLGWMQHLTSKWGTAANGGLRYYLMDNEPSIWFSTHRDVHPVGPTMDEILADILDYGGKVKANDPSALVIGPEEWGWSAYFYSGYDQQYAPLHNWSAFPDRANHGGQDYLPWLLDQLHQHEISTGQRLLDVFSVHYYPQSGEFGDDVSTAMQLLRNRSTRSLWDPNYTDASWINSVVQLIPRLKGWVNTYYPGTQTAITEYSWGADNHINGATTEADVLGIFGREGLDMACRWMAPAASSPVFNAMKLYRNYDGKKSTFGDTSVAATVANPDDLSSFAAVRSTDGALTVMVINKALTGSTPVTLNLRNFAAGGSAHVYQLTSANQIARLANSSVSHGAIATTVPAQSITLFVVPALTPPPSVSMTATATATPSLVTTGGTSKVVTHVTCASGPLTDGVVDVEVYDSTGTLVSRKYWTAQTLAAGQSHNYSWSWVAPATPGVYTVEAGVFSAHWSENLYWNSNAATIRVTQQDAAQYNFETDTQGWAVTGGMLTGVATSTAQQYAGISSLAVQFAGAAADTQAVYVAGPSTPAGKTVTFHVWIPTGSGIAAVQPYVQQGASGGWAWTGDYQQIANLTANAWNTFTVTVPSNAATPLYQLGVQFFTAGAWTGTCYVDSISW